MNETRYVVGFDGSPGAQAALRWALAEVVEGETVEAVAIWQPPTVVLNPWVPTAVLDEAALGEQFRQHVRSRVEEVAGDAPVAIRFLTDTIGRGLIQAATGARCLAVGRRGHGGFVGLLVGSVADYALRHASGALALVPEHDAACLDGDVVVGIDGSPDAAAALRWASGEADRRHRPLVALHAWDWLVQPGSFNPGFNEQAATRYARDFVVRTLGERPVEVTAVSDQPAAALMERSRAGDLVVVGSRGLGAVRQTLLGSVSRQLAHHAPSTVVVVHPPA